MLLISYDISNDKLRTKFSKYLTRYGERLQYSVFKIKNSERILKIIMSEIQNYYSKQFSEDDSIYIYTIDGHKNIIKYGRAKHDDDDFLII